MRFSPVRVSIERGGVSRTLASASLLVGVIFTLAGLRLVFREPAVLLFGLVALVPFALYRRMARPGDGVTVEATPDALVVGERRFPTARFSGAWARDAQTAVVVLDDRTEIALALAPASRRADELLEALDWSVAKRILPTPLRGQLGPFTIGFCTFVASSLGAITLADRFPLLRENLGWLLLASFAFAVGLAKLLASPHVVLGADGLRIARGPLHKFVRYADVAEVEPLPRGEGLRVRLLSGRTLSLPMVAQDDASVAALVERIRDGRVRASASVGGSLATLLTRGGRSGTRWRADLEALASRATGFRDLAVTPEALSRELEDARAPREVRVAAALALEAMEPGGSRVSAAVATCADPELRPLLEAVRDGTLDDDSLEALVGR